MKKTAVTILVLTCLTGCGKNGSPAQKASESKPAEARQYRPSTEWEEVSRGLVHPITKEGFILYNRAVPTDGNTKEIKVEIGVQYVTNSGKGEIIPKWHYMVDCKKGFARTDKRVVTPKENSRLFEFACGTSPTTEILGTNAAAEVQAPQSTKAENQAPSQSNSPARIFYTDRHSIRIINDRGSYTYQAWKQPKQLDEGKPDLEVKDGRIDRSDSDNCMNGQLIFKKGNLLMRLQQITGINKACFSGPPANATGKLEIFINGERKDNYWLYRN